MTAPVKPPYEVPTMADINALDWNGYNAVSTFSGCGGSSLGYRMAGFRVLYANEFVPAARDTYRANQAPYTHLDDRDIRDVTGADLLDWAGLGVGEIDLFDGSPPCGSFSTAGKRQEGWGEVKKYSDVEQRSDDLFFEYARLIEETQPRTFVAENVSGLVKGSAKGYFQLIMRALKATGYRVEARLLDAQWLGVPQKRQRLIFVGVRDDLNLDPVFPDPLPYRYTTRDALRPLRDRPVKVMKTPEGLVVDNDVAQQIEGYAIGEEWHKTPPGGKSTRYLSLTKPSLDAPIGTITARAGGVGTAGVVHPTEPRKFTMRELRALGGFPEDFVLTGSYTQRWERIGRAVPPVMMAHVAAAVRDNVLAVADGKAEA